MKAEVCPQCGYATAQDRSPLALPIETELRGRYQIGRVLGEPGGFGVTYLGYDQRLELKVAIKEYVPRGLAGRGTDGVSVVPYSTGDQEEFAYGLDRFLGEAKALAQFDHANIVSVRDFFETNGTAYLVMDYYEGKTLKQYLQEQSEGRMDPKNATEIMLRVLDGLKEVHTEGYLHRDIKPSNIYLTEDGRPILIDFGAARLALGEKSRSLSVVMTEGYAPYEQYRREGDQGPYTDVYGCGATLYRMVTGEKPPPATDRVVEDTLKPPHEVKPGVSEGLGEVIVEALAPGNKERISTPAELQERLQAPAEKERNEREIEAEARPDVETKSFACGGKGREVPPKQRMVEEGGREPGDLVDGPISPLRSLLGRMKSKWYYAAGGLTLAVALGVLIYVGVREIKQNRTAKRLAERGAMAMEEGNLQAAVDLFERSLEIMSRPKVRKQLESAKIRAGRVPIRTLRRDEAEVWSLAFSPDGSLVATGGANATARLWSVQTGEAVQVLRGHGHATVWSLAFSPGGSLVATGGTDGTARLWSAETGKEVQVLGHGGGVNTLAFSPGGSLVATGSADGTARLWSAETGEEVRVLEHGNPVGTLAFSPDGSLLATGSADGPAKLWYVPEGP